MSVVCDACGRSNRAAAMFCMGRAARLPGFAASGLPALETVPAAALPALKPVSLTPAHPTDPLALWLQLGVPVLAMTVAFAAWYLYIQRTDAEAPLPSRASALALDRTSPVPAAPLMATPVTEALAGLPSSARLDVPGEVVARFYRALSAGDGKTAAAFVTPAKQGVPAFSEAALSKFYGSFKDPLLLRSIRQIDANVVEAKYRYRVTKTACEGTAIVETEPGLQGRVIRSIRANC